MMTDTQKAPSPENLSFEQSMQQLDEIVRKLESGQASLEESITLYEQGVKLRQHCEKKLSDAQARIEKITVGQDGQISTEPLDPQNG